MKEKNKVLQNISLGILIANTILLILLYFIPTSDRLGWTNNNVIENIKTPLFDFEKFGTYFNIQGDSFLLIEQFNALPISFSTEHFAFYGIVLMISFSIYLSSISGLTKLWHALFFGVFALLIGTFHLENLEILHQIHDKAFTALVLIAFTGLSYYFHRNQHIKFLVRCASFLILISGIILLIQLVTPNVNWYIESIAYCFPSLSLLTLAFILFASMAIPFGILYLSTFKNVGGSGDSIKHFLFFYIVYLLNLVYCYFVLFYQQDLDIYYIPPFLLLIIASFVGLWVIKQQEELFSSILRDKNILYWVYVSGALIALSSLSFHKAIFDSSFVKAAEQTTVATMLGFGCIFLIYILYNFYDVLKKNLQVYKVAFKPKNIDFLSTWGVGLLIVIGLLYIQHFAPFNLAKASYFNNLGDAEYIDGQYFLAENRYNTASVYHYNNYHSNYMLGQIAEKNKNKTVAGVAYKYAYKGGGIEQAFSKSASLEIDKKNYLESLFILKEGLKEYPKSEILHNNLALAFLNINELDSALFYLEAGISLNKDDNKVLKGNYIAISALAKKEVNEHSKYLSEIDNSTSLIESVNQLALLNTDGIASAQNFAKSLVNDSTLNGDEVSYIYNYALNNSLKEQPEVLGDYIAKYMSIQNSDYKQQLLFAYGWTQKANNNQKEFLKAFKDLDKFYGINNAYYNFITGLEALNNDQYVLAEHKLAAAWKLGQKSAIYPLALTNSILGNHQKAVQLFDLCERFKIIDTEDKTLIHHYTSSKQLKSDSEKDYFYQLLFNYQKMSNDEVLKSLKGLSLKSNQEDLLTMILNYKVKTKQADITSLIQQFKKQFDASDDLNVEMIFAKYQMDLPIDEFKTIENNPSVAVDFANHLVKNDTTLFETEALFLNPAYQKYIVNSYIQKGEDDKSFEWVTDAISVNPYSELNVQNYFYVAIPQGLKDYAHDIMVDSEYYLDDAATERINELYSTLVNDYHKSINTWN
ncbi:hypothetical protein MY04_3257 [Flammeovirga sp. MY04]|uniref:hypothetical protein n=1 Tax=Flammeovirga sp. MY04 TaxID=1191459 RepID=UPI0008062496|nr:hypothetical protein [Flammeovirga sp. MY04]ANQ50622.1 hypothetical protein MY04_3257 [Flammeovirga sp. MY04]